MGSELTKISLIVLFATLSAAAVPQARADIYKCTDEEGNVAYLQLPCPAKAVKKPDAVEDANPSVAESTPETSKPEAATPSSRIEGELLNDCKKRFRDQIDEIDAQIPGNNTPDQANVFKERLLALTRQLRACG